MKAFVLTPDGWGHADVPDPRPEPGQVVVRTTAAGLCHSDLTLAARPATAHPFELPLVLGHELAGTVVEASPLAPTLHVGDRVVGYGPRGCGQCHRCAAGAENYCTAPPVGAMPGLGAPGALAQYVALDGRYLVPTPVLPAVEAAALTDAGLTAFHALNRALAAGSAAVAPTPTVVILGVGGLGHVAAQLAHRAGAVVIAVDRAESKLELARRVGADHVLSSSTALADQVRDLTSGGADVVLDLVASTDTLAHAAAMVRADGVVSIAGVGQGRLAVGMHAVPLGVRVDLPFWGTRPELHRLVEMASAGRVGVVTETYAFDDTAHAYARLERGEVLGRAVIVDP